MLSTPTDDLDLDFASLTLAAPPRRTGRIVPAERPARFAVVVYGRRIGTRPTLARAQAFAARVGGSVEVAS
jgi:hypothetical protein